MAHCQHDEHVSDIDDYDGSVQLLEFDPNVSPLNELVLKKRNFSFPRPIKIDEIKHVSDLDTLFNYNIDVFKTNPKMKLRATENNLDEFLESKEKSNNKLCKLLLTQHYCVYNNDCKFVHHFNSIKSCKYDFCRKTKLVGPGTFINTTNFICKMKHRMESLHSFIWRTRHKTDSFLTLFVYVEFEDEFKKIFSATAANSTTPNIKIVIIDNNKPHDG